MQVRASARGVRMSARKAQLVVEQIRGRPVTEALAILQFDPHAAARVVWKVVRSAAANAENNYSLDADDLFVVSATADQGPSLPPKFRAKARGQAAIISRKTTHITVVVDDEPGQLLRQRRLLQTRAAGRTPGSAAPRPRRAAAPAPPATTDIQATQVSQAPQASQPPPETPAVTATATGPVATPEATDTTEPSAPAEAPQAPHTETTQAPQQGGGSAPQ